MIPWNFARRLSAGFAASLLISLIIAAIAFFALQWVVESKDAVISERARELLIVEKVRNLSLRKSGQGRAFLLSGADRHLEERRATRSELLRTIDSVSTSGTRAQQLVSRVRQAEEVHERALNEVMAMQQAGASPAEVSGAFETRIEPRFEELDAALDALAEHKSALLEEARLESSRVAGWATRFVLAMAGLALFLNALIAWLLSRGLTRQVGSAVQHLQSSSTELQASARQQTSAAQEQSAATTQISTTIRELLTTSRQIADSAQQVARAAGETTAVADRGTTTVARAQEAVTGIKRQMDVMVTHMLDLGRKSQQIGGILELIRELAEQTNILSINAAIEAAGAGEAGRRFAVVADEIRKLADRVGNSTKDIRVLIDDIRAAANTSTMATEEAAKAVDHGTRQFSEMAATIKRITDMISTTAEAAREIELSTRQQTTAVEQVNVAIANVAQASVEAEATSRQTLQIASELARLSRDLTDLVGSTPVERR